MVQGVEYEDIVEIHARQDLLTGDGGKKMSNVRDTRRAKILVVIFMPNFPAGIPFPMTISVLRAPIKSSGTRTNFRVSFLIARFRRVHLV